MVEPKNRKATRYGSVAKALRGQDFDAESGGVTVAYNPRITSGSFANSFQPSPPPTIPRASPAIFPSLSIPGTS